MVIGASTHPLQYMGSQIRLRAIPLLILSLLFCRGLASPQASTTRAKGESGPPAFEGAESLLAQGQLEQAKAKIQEQLKLTPTSIEGYNLLGIIYSNQKDYEHALDAFQQALKAKPNSTKTHNNLANLYVLEGKSELAERELRKVLQLEPANRDGNYNLGLLLMAKGAPAEAIPHFQRVRPKPGGSLQPDARVSASGPDGGRIEDGQRLSSAEQVSSSDCISRWVFCWLLRISSGRRSSNWRRPTHFSRKPPRFFTTLDKLTFGIMSTPKPCPSCSGRSTEAGVARCPVFTGADCGGTEASG